MFWPVTFDALTRLGWLCMQLFFPLLSGAAI